MRLGVALQDAAKSLADLNAEAEDDAENDDFRVTLITSERRRRLARDGQIVEKSDDAAPSP